MAENPIGPIKEKPKPKNVKTRIGMTLAMGTTILTGVVGSDREARSVEAAGNTPTPAPTRTSTPGPTFTPTMTAIEQQIQDAQATAQALQKEKKDEQKLADAKATVTALEATITPTATKTPTPTATSTPRATSTPPPTATPLTPAQREATREARQDEAFGRERAKLQEEYERTRVRPTQTAQARIAQAEEQAAADRREAERNQDGGIPVVPIALGAAAAAAVVNRRRIADVGREGLNWARRPDRWRVLNVMARRRWRQLRARLPF